MNEIDVLIAELRKDLAETQVRLDRALAIKASQESEGNPLWSDPDGNGARKLLPIENLRQEWAASTDRAKRFAAVDFNYFHNNNYINPLGDTIPDDIDEIYRKAHTQSVPLFMLGVNPGAVETDVEGVYIYVHGNKDAVEARKILEANWTDSDFIQQEYADAVQRMRDRDFDYKLAVMEGTGDQFLKDHPHFEPKKK